MIYPTHVALIPDWNRTWAKEKWLPQLIWHMEWFKRFIELSEFLFKETPVKVFTIWWLSTENLTNRSPEELEYLFDLYKRVPWDLEKIMSDNEINFRWVWSEKWLPQHLIDYLRNMENTLKFDTDKYINLCVNYWWRDEIIRWINKVIESWESMIESEKQFSKYLDFGDLPQVDLIIRTKWDLARRLSGFMLWWAWYAELYFSNLKCPDFSKEEMHKALVWFDEISSERNFGK